MRFLPLLSDNQILIIHDTEDYLGGVRITASLGPLRLGRISAFDLTPNTVIIGTRDPGKKRLVSTNHA